MARWLAVLHPACHAIEIRAPDRRYNVEGRVCKTTLVNRFRKVREAATDAYQLSGTAPAVYVVLNGINPALRCGRRLKGGASAADIPRRFRLLIDCDPTREGTVSATDEEKAEAFKVMEAIRAYLRARGWPEPITADSGNGWHLVYAIDLPNDDDSTALVKADLAALAAKFDTAAVKVDCVVFDAPRLVKFYGTLSAKGESTPERPHRYSRVLTAPAELETVPTELLRALAAETPPKPFDMDAEIQRKRDQAETDPEPPPILSIDEHLSRTAKKARADDRGERLSVIDDFNRNAKWSDLLPAGWKHDHNRGDTEHWTRPGKDGGTSATIHRNDADRLYLFTTNAPPFEPNKPYSKFDAYLLLHPGLTLKEGVKALAAEGYGTPRTKANPRASSDGPAGTAPPATEPSTNGDGQPPNAPTAGQTEQADPIRPNEAPDDPHRLARVILDKFSHGDGRTLAYHQETFYRWEGTAYRPDPSFVPVVLVNEIKSELDRLNVIALEDWERQSRLRALAGGTGKPAARPQVQKVTKVLVSNVAQAVAAMASVRWDADAPFWITAAKGDPDPFSIVPANNALVILGKQSVVCLDLTPRLFSTNSLPYNYEYDAPPPVEWVKFLKSQWGDDPESMRELQKWFGLILTPETKYQKILLLIGPTRSGRSTIKDVMTKLIGARNVVATSPVAMADRFGLENFVGKTMAIMGDARTGDTHDAAILTDRILRISGEDAVEINRKGRVQLDNVFLRTRLVIVSNEMPNFRDNSGAIVGRYLPLLMKETFSGREDLGLPKRLEAELPSILKWAITGQEMLRDDGRFNVPETSKHLLDDASSLASPVAMFVAEECSLGDGFNVSVDNLWVAWKAWADRNGHKPGTKQVFGRNLKPATGYKIKTTQPRDGDARYREYQGIELRVIPPAANGKPHTATAWGPSNHNAPH